MRVWARHRHQSGIEHRRALAIALEQSGDAVEITDQNLRITYINPAFTEILGYTRDDIIGQTAGKVTRSGIQPASYFENIERTLASGRVWRGPLMTRAKNGRIVHFDAMVTPILDGAGQAIAYVSIRRDMTERLAHEAQVRAAHRELARARDEALSANRVKSQFLANMSHELRTPLNAIIGYSEMLAEEAEDLDEVDFLADIKKVHSAGKHLLTLINDILDLSKIEAGKLELFFEPLELPELIRNAVTLVQPLAQDRGNTIAINYQLDIATVTTDATRLKQVLYNLLSNAAKFTENGTITVDVRRDDLPSTEATKDVGPMFAIEVRDTGIGIDPKVMERLFRPFVQADASTTRRYGGTGLGLTISARFAELMGGALNAYSEVGHGSTFTLRLPLHSSSSLPIVPVPTTSKHRPKVLVIDDDPPTHDLLRRTLGPLGVHLLSAQSGSTGIEMASEHRPDLIILDIVMPGMDGWSVLARLKKTAATREVPVVMLTFLEDRNAGLALGAVDYLIKPIEPSRLVAVVRRLCGGSQAQVLVVEDDEATRQITARVLATAGFEVHTANDGEEALVAMNRIQPDIVVVDLLMPKVDGFTLIDRLRDHPEFHRVPVVVMTAKTLTERERHRLQGATQQILNKSDYSLRELMRAVLTHVSRLLPDKAAAEP